MKDLPTHHLFSPFYPPVLEPNPDLRLPKLKLLSQLLALAPCDVLTAHKFSFHSLQLSHCKHGTGPLVLEMVTHKPSPFFRSVIRGLIS